MVFIVSRYQVPSRQWLRAKVVEASDQKKEQLKKQLRDLPADRAVTLTLDLWSSRSLLSYFGVTVHFIQDGTLRAELLAFRYCHLASVQNIRWLVTEQITETMLF